MPLIETLESRLQRTTVALFSDPQFLSQGATSPVTCLRTFLDARDLTVRELSDSLDFTMHTAEALEGVDVLILPPFLGNDIRAGLNGFGGDQALQEFVSSGRTIISIGDERGALHNSKTLNQVFGWGIYFQFYAAFAPISINAADAAGTGFVGGPATLVKNDDTFILSAGYPDGTKFPYRFPDGEPAIARIPFGEGYVTQLGWNFNNAKPAGTQDGGWLEVLDRAIADGVANAPFASLDNGLLHINGTSGDDVIGMYQLSSNGTTSLRITRNGRTTSFDKSAVTSISILGGNGNDNISCTPNGIPGYVSGGSGNDRLTGGSDNDTFLGGAGKDTIYGGEGNDRLNGAGGVDRVYGEGGDDRLYGGDNNDVLDGGGGKDRLYGEDGDDFLIGGGSNDRLYGGAGADYLDGGTGRDIADGGAGSDRAKRDDTDTRIAVEVLT